MTKRRGSILMVGLLAILAALVPVSTASAAPPARSDSTNENVYFVHGYDATDTVPAHNCSTYWDDAIAVMRGTGGGWSGALHTVAFYAADTGCSVRSSSADRATSIKTLGRDLAWLVYNRETRYGRSADLVGHSMGGLIIRAALTGVEARESGFPATLYVEDVVTLATPHHGTTLFTVPCRTTQCVEMLPRSTFLNWLHQGPQSSQGTDWTLTGAYGDGYVEEDSAVAWTDGYRIDYNIGHRHKYHGVNHTTIIENRGGIYTVDSWHHYARTWRHTTAGWAALVGMRWGLYYWSRE
jgi:triacylglycerol esterase/lipase EstA (alpha/beta hydrolase family)